MNTVEKWFGDAFTELDPLLQDLHRFGGTLSGSVHIQFGSGIAGFLGRRLATKMGMPNQAGTHHMTVRIGSQEDKLVWSRNFGGSRDMISIFKPQGKYPDGTWSETTGNLNLSLSVDVVDGGWHWIQRGARIGSISIPLWLMPVSRAYKRITSGMYEFSVTLSLPIFGMAFCYSGMLSLVERGV